MSLIFLQTGDSEIEVMAQPVPETINFPAEEEKIMELWKELDAFQTSLKLSKSRPR